MHEAGFLLLYQLFSRNAKLAVRTNGHEVDAHSLASLLACFYTDVAPGKEDAAVDATEMNNILPSLVVVLAHNEKICKESELKSLDTTGFEFDSPSPDTVWRVRSLDTDKDGFEPLGRLLEELMEWFKRTDLVWPTYTQEKRVPVEVDSKVDSRGLFARRPIGTLVSDSSCVSRTLESPNRGGTLVDALQHAATFSECALPHDAYSALKPLQPIIVDDSFTVREPTTHRTRHTLGYAISLHEQPQRHAHAMAVVQRIEDDIKAYHDRSIASQEKHRFATIAREFEAAVATNATDRRVVNQQAATAAAETATVAMKRLEGALREQQAQQMEVVNNSLQVLIVLANHVEMPHPSDGKPDTAKKYRFALLKLAGQETAIDFNFLVTSLMSGKLKKEWCDVNPFIGETPHDNLQRLLVAVLLLASGVAHTNQVIYECTKLQRMLGELVNTLETDENSQELALGLVNLADSVAASLHVTRHYVDERGAYDPRLLVFEFIREVILRKGQVKLVQQFMSALDTEALDTVKKRDPSRPKLAQQMLMGQGKTAIITPLLCLLLADGKRQPIVMLPDPLLEAGQDIVRTTFSNVIAKRVYTLLCTRASVADPRHLSKLQGALRSRGVIMTTPGSVKAMMLKFLEATMALSDDNRARKNAASGRHLSQRQRATLVLDAVAWGQLIESFQRCVLIMDELDWVTNPMKSEMNFPIGSKSPLDLGQLDEGKRWEVPMHLWNGVFAAETQVLPPNLKGHPEAASAAERLFLAFQEGFSRGSMQRRPHVILLDKGFYFKELLPAMVDWLLIFLQAERVGATHKQVTTELLRKCLAGEVLADDERIELDSLPSTEAKLLKLSRDWLITFLPYCAPRHSTASLHMRGPIHACFLQV